MSGASLRLSNLTKRYGDQVAVDDISLHIASGEFVTFLGPSGSGKTTTLNMIAGFLPPTAGSVHVDDRNLTHIPAHRRDIGVVFQDYLLFPHMTVRQNVEFPLREHRVRKAARAEMIAPTLALVGLEGFAQRYPRELSGGQQQRVALARALVFRPRLLLLDEPLGALDKKLRESLRLELKRIHREVGITFVNVTHDQEEALVLSDRIVVFNDGRIEQVGRPGELYERPASQFVATFVGESNLFHGRYASGVVDTGRLRLSVVEDPARGAGGPATVLVRPERLQLQPGASAAVAGSASGVNVVSGRVRQVIYVGLGRIVEVVVGGVGDVVVRELAGSTTSFDAGDDVTVAWRIADSWLLPHESAAPATADRELALGSVERGA
jgi:putative spermidine/putrescine transport system ATP-binding protein